MEYFPYRNTQNPILLIKFLKPKSISADSSKVPGSKQVLRFKTNEQLSVELISGKLGQTTIKVATMDGSQFSLANADFQVVQELVLKGKRENPNKLEKDLKLLKAPKLTK